MSIDDRNRRGKPGATMRLIGISLLFGVLGGLVGVILVQVLVAPLFTWMSGR